MIHVIDLNFKNCPLCIAAFVIQQGDTTVLVETGPYSCIHNLEAGLNKIELSTDSIDAVFVTHIHFDHAGSSWYFADKNKKIYLHPNGFRHLARPGKLVESARRIYLDKMDELWGAIQPINENLLVQVKDGEEILIGDIAMTAHYTPGHAKHHIAWQYQDNFFTGDVGGCRIMQGPLVLPTPPPDLNFEDWIASLKKIAALNPKTLYLTHFGKFNDTEFHISHLIKQLDYLYSLTEICTEKFMDSDVPEILLNTFYGAHYAAFPIKEEESKAYANISPNWMNAQGIQRYWQLKRSSV